MSAQTAQPPPITEAPKWTAELVCQRMIEAFRKLPSVPIVIPRGDVLQPARPIPRPAELDMITLSAQHLGRDSDERRFLLAWASARASGRSVRDHCRQMGWPRETFQRKRKAACRLLAERLNSASIPST